MLAHPRGHCPHLQLDPTGTCRRLLAPLLVVRLRVGHGLGHRDESTRWCIPSGHCALLLGAHQAGDQAGLQGICLSFFSLS